MTRKKQRDVARPRFQTRVKSRLAEQHCVGSALARLLNEVVRRAATDSDLSDRFFIVANDRQFFDLQHVFDLRD